MKKIISHPEYFFWLIAFVFLLSVFLFRQESVDFDLAGTYFVVAYPLFALFLALTTVLTGLVYWFFRRRKIPLSDILTVVHVLLMALGLSALFVFFLYGNSRPVPEGPEFFENVEQQMQAYFMNRRINWLVLAVFMLTALAQLVFVLNMLFSYLKGRKQ
ncbi:hypothetical protein [Robiginitalea sp. IMCC43444]|uniref:hypothetical protein n=1 Tax=Robiginitalea sp. IMCC43444 TaxID=3459121 RepID=UPI0040414225